MRTTHAVKVDKEISECLEQLNMKEKEVVLSVIKTFIESRHENNVWESKTLLEKLDRRTSEFEAGKAKVLNLNQLEAGARKAYKARAAGKR